MPSDDVHTHALSSSDYYGLLEIPPSSSDSEIRRAYRKAALKYHPDKHGGSVDAVDKFHTLQIAYDVLSDPAAREVYDNGRKAREAREERDRQLGARKRKMKEDLERREGKRSREEVEEEERMEMKMRRLAAEGARRRKELDEKRRAEAEREQSEAERQRTGASDTHMDAGLNGGSRQEGEVSELERAIKIRWRREGASAEIDKSQLEGFFKRYGAVDIVMVMKDKKKKLDDGDGQVQRKALVATALVVYLSIASAHAAVEETPKAWAEEFGDSLESALWANGEEPAYIGHLRDPSSAPPTTPLTQDEARRIRVRLAAKRQRETREARKAAEEVETKEAQQEIRKVPSFASFKGPSTPLRPPPKVSFSATNTPQAMTPGQLQKKRDEERRALEAEIRAREAAEDAAGH